MQIRIVRMKETTFNKIVCLLVVNKRKTLAILPQKKSICFMRNSLFSVQLHFIEQGWRRLVTGDKSFFSASEKIRSISVKRIFGFMTWLNNVSQCSPIIWINLRSVLSGQFHRFIQFYKNYICCNCVRAVISFPWGLLKLTFQLLVQNAFFCW